MYADATGWLGRRAWPPSATVEAMGVITVVLVDDHTIIREGVAALLDADPDIEVVGQFARGEDLLDDIDALRPDIAVLDLRLPGMGAPELCDRLRRRLPGIGVLMQTSAATEGAILTTFSAGARSLVLAGSPTTPDILVQAIRWVDRDATYIDPRIGGRVVAMLLRHSRAKGPFGLTTQERRVLAQLPHDLTNREIAENLGISINTVKTHLGNALRKLDVRDRNEAAAIAEREGFV